MSWNKLSPKSFAVLLNIIARNNQLTYLNFSWNMLLEDQKAMEEENKDRRKNVGRFEEDKGKDKGKVFNEQLTLQAEVAIGNLCMSIKKNTKLIHADFSNTGLNEK